MYHVQFGGAESPGLPTEEGDLAFTLYLTKHSFLIIKKIEGNFISIVLNVFSRDC